MDITLSIDDEVAGKVYKIAADKNTTVEAMVQDYLASVASAETPALDAAAREEAADKLCALVTSIVNSDVGGRDTTAGEEAVNKLRESWDQLSRPMGPRNWTRDDLYDRFDHKTTDRFFWGPFRNRPT